MSETEAAENRIVDTQTHELPQGQSVAVLFGFTLSQILVIVLWPLLVACGLFFFGFATKSELNQVVEGVKARHPVKVYNVTARIRAASSDGLTPDQVMESIEADVERLSKAGFVVIDERTILAAPASAKAQGAQ